MRATEDVRQLAADPTSEAGLERMRRAAPRARHPGLERAGAKRRRLGVEGPLDHVIQVLCGSHVAALAKEHIAQGSALSAQTRQSKNPAIAGTQPSIGA